MCKKQHLPQAIHVLTKQGLPEQEAVRQVDELLLKFGVTKVRAKFDAFLWRHQMKSPKKGMDPEEKGRVQRTQMQQSRPLMKPMNDFY